MPQAAECLNLARREVELFSDEWVVARENECRQLGMIIRKALYTHDHVVATDEFYRAMIGENKCTYDRVIDVKILSLMVAWMDVSKEIHDQASDLQFYGFDIDHSDRFNRQLENITWILAPAFSNGIEDEWEQLLTISREGFRFKRYQEKDNEWWANAPTIRPLTTLRKKNMINARIVGEELDEFTDLKKFPGTLLGELREPIVVQEAQLEADAIR